MTNTVMNFTKGVIAGVVVGAAVGAVAATATRPANPIKKNTDKAIKAVNHFVENVSGAMNQVK